MLAFLLLGERPPPQDQLASLLFAEADDPLRRAALEPGRDPAGARPGRRIGRRPGAAPLPANATVDVDVLGDGDWGDAVELPGWAGPARRLLHPERRGLRVVAAPQRRRFAAATESILHEAALGHLARGDLDRARDLAARAAVLSPLDENHQALLIRLYRLAGDDDAAERQFAAWSRRRGA